MEPRSVPAIALSESNQSGGHFFMSLQTGKKLHGYKWNILPYDDHVIDRVKELAMSENQPELVKGNVIFGFNMDEMFDEQDIENEELIMAEENSNADSSGVQNEVRAIVDDENINENIVTDDDLDLNDLSDSDDDDEFPINEDAIEIVDDENENEDLSTEGMGERKSENDSDMELFNDGTGVDDSILGRIDTITEELEQNIKFGKRLMEEGESQDISRNDSENCDDSLSDESESEEMETTRPKRQCVGKDIDRLEVNFNNKTYVTDKHIQLLMKSATGVNHVKTSIDTQSYMSRAVNVLFTQLPAREGIKKHGARAIAALVKEFRQLDKGPMAGKRVVEPVVYSTLTDEEKRDALEAITLTKEKRDGTIKGRCCANGKKQRRLQNRFLEYEINYSSPTSSNEAVLTTAIIDAKEKRDVCTADIPGAYLHAILPKNKKRVLLKLTGIFVDIMVEANAEYEKYVVYEKGKKVLYLRVLRALYGCIESALLWYDLYSTTLEKEGFVINPYDRCVANKIINGKQCTIVFYVDDNKISHVDPDVVTNVVDKLKEHFGSLTVTRGKKHDFLGMELTFMDDGTLKLEMKKLLKETLGMVDEDLSASVSSPATKRLFEISETADKLSEEKSALFHSIVAKLLYLTKRSRPDIETAVSFLRTRVTKCDEEDWKKLIRLLCFLNKTKNDPRIMGADSLKKLYSWIDASHAVHEDMKGHTGGATSFGTGVVNTKSTKQKLNTKSSTESELVGVSEYLPHCIWFLYFLEQQGYPLDKNVIFQDNVSAIRMEQNGRNSCTGNSRHINIRFFFIKDRVDSEEVSVCYCPTESMLGDFYTKALQGSLFNKFRNVIMGYSKITTIMPPNISQFEERVGNTNGIPANYRNIRKTNDKGKKVNFSDKVRYRTYKDRTYDDNSGSKINFQEDSKNKSTSTYIVSGNDKTNKNSGTGPVIGSGSSSKQNRNVRMDIRSL